ncbi:MAG TPA: hypothetical protein VNA67_07145 [Pseudonocardiaceae bacterium]|nr:hypothetical protein [Pseudonocardiaceae bacterium]
MGAARTVTTGSGRALRALSGVLAGGLVVLAVALCAAQWLAGTSGRPGPGTAAVVGHLVAALATVALQLAADRLRGRIAVLASGSVLVIAAGVLWFGWYA